MLNLECSKLNTTSAVNPRDLRVSHNLRMFQIQIQAGFFDKALLACVVNKEHGDCIEGNSAALFHVTDNPLVVNDLLTSGGTMEIQCL